MPEGRWWARCSGCGNQFHRFRRPKCRNRWFCRDCGPTRGPLVWQFSCPVSALFC
jgi:hypothetical protein